MLYLVATPIGNLTDITFRAIEVLKACDYILCEDTRHSQILLKTYEILKPLKSYHKFNEASQAPLILKDLQAGKQLAFISDAGTPGISDPGTALAQLCVKHDIPFTAIPGACAAIQALVCSGLPTERFQFWGFLPKKDGALKQDLQTILSYSGTTICYESPHRLLHVLQLIHSYDPLRDLVVGRELTKKFEETRRGHAQALIEYWETKTLKGEIVLLISPASPQLLTSQWQELSPEEHVQTLQETYALSRQEAIKMAAQLRGVSKRSIYQTIHQNPSISP